MVRKLFYVFESYDRSCVSFDGGKPGGCLMYIHQRQCLERYTSPTFIESSGTHFISTAYDRRGKQKWILYLYSADIAFKKLLVRYVDIRDCYSLHLFHYLFDGDTFNASFLTEGRTGSTIFPHLKLGSFFIIKPNASEYGSRIHARARF